MIPSVGRIVHYRPHNDGPCVASIITRVNDNGYPDLTLFYPGDGHGLIQINVPLESESRPENGMTWHWPERVE